MSWRRAILATAVVLPLLALLALGLRMDPRDIPSPLPGRSAPDFALAVMPAADDAAPAADTIRLSDHVGEVVVLNFWASWCLACIDEHGALSAVAEAYEGQPVQFYGVLYNDTPPLARRFIERLGGQSYPTLLDPRSRTAIAYGLRGVPETFFIAPDGSVDHRHVGPVTARLLRQRIDPLLGSRGEVAREGEQ